MGVCGCVYYIRPVIKEKATCAVATCQNNIFIAMVCDSKSYAIILWRVIIMKLSIGKKITELEIMTLNRKKA